LIDSAFGHPQVGHPAQVLDLVTVPLPTLQEVDSQISGPLSGISLTNRNRWRSPVSASSRSW
jgi:hypothetical protein